MKEIKHTHPDGTRATYRVNSPAPLEKILDPKTSVVKPTRPKADKRIFPKWTPAMSSREYVARYFDMNASVRSGVHASFVHSRTDDFGLLNLSDEPASWVTDVVEAGFADDDAGEPV